jgi:dolichol-phosphate mannosyltransferase
MTEPPELSIVMPVYNEAAAIEGVVREWAAEMQRLGITYEMLLYDDGSRDGTAAALDRLAATNGRVIARTHANRGHGPTILRGYGEARGTWLFQTDSDGEMPAAGFESLWARRADYDLLVGRRGGRRLSAGRFLLTFGSRQLIALAFGRAIRDVNSPYRLMRGSWMRERVLPFLPPDTAVPNIAICGIAARSHARVHETVVAYVPRRQGRSSVSLRRAIRLAWRGVIESLRIMRAVSR